MQWLSESVFPVADANGMVALLTVGTFRAHLEELAVPQPYQFAERCCSTDFLHDPYHIVYEGHSVGISAYPCVFSSCGHGDLQCTDCLVSLAFTGMTTITPSTAQSTLVAPACVRCRRRTHSGGFGCWSLHARTSLVRTSRRIWY